MDVKSLIPKNLRELPLWDRISDIVQRVVDEREEEFADFLVKYQDIPSLSEEALSSTLKELGYGYILDIIDLTKATLQNIVVLASLIHLLKGSRAGLEMVLKLLNLSYVIEEWWENPGVSNEPVTFKLVVDLGVTNIKIDAHNRIKKFLNNYVYPSIFYESIGDADDQLVFQTAGFSDRKVNASYGAHSFGFLLSGAKQTTITSHPIGE